MPPKPHRIALGVEYAGDAYSGWQIQKSPSLPTVQGELQRALGRIADHPITVHCAGRTDKGVHATAQIVHFDCAIDRGSKAWTQGANSLLPRDIRVIWAQPVAEDFHARFSATHRRYIYVLRPSSHASAFSHGRSLALPVDLDCHAMNAAAQYLLGEQDFSAFRAAGCQSKTANRCVQRISVTRENGMIIVDIQANAFLLHMVRNIVGSLIVVGRDQRPGGWIAELLSARSRSLAAKTAEPDGLYLVEVGYPEHYGLPKALRLPWYLRSTS